ncbi:glycyl-tRNA synthetase beta subunit [Ochrobactrum daejeonense]|uniref:Glycyl-tRNA synthetase beta subunit n=1 Tax=Brucella daejeonensis TaxID=659015 RepID=A0A7W9EPT9_9HYPH|nr:glycyl-tRNA synthetase beta subunit [Brucella daejeonensis]
MPDLLLELFFEEIPATPSARSEARTDKLNNVHAEGVR